MFKSAMNRFLAGGLVAAAIMAVAQPSLGALKIDLRVVDSNGNPTATPNAVTVNAGDVVHIGLFAVVTGANGSTSDEGFQSAYGSVVSTLTSSGSGIGDMSTFTAASPFTTSSQTGKVQDLNGQAGLDLGSTSSSATDYLFARSSAMVSGSDFLIGTLDWTVSSVGTGSTTLSFVPRSGTATAVWREDNTTKAPATGSFAAGNSITVAVPEPTTMALLGLAVPAVLRRRRASR